MIFLNRDLRSMHGTNTRVRPLRQSDGIIQRRIQVLGGGGGGGGGHGWWVWLGVGSASGPIRKAGGGRGGGGCCRFMARYEERGRGGGCCRFLARYEGRRGGGGGV